MRTPFSSPPFAFLSPLVGFLTERLSDFRRKGARSLNQVSFEPPLAVSVSADGGIPTKICANFILDDFLFNSIERAKVFFIFSPYWITLSVYGLSRWPTSEWNRITLALVRSIGRSG